MKQLTIDEMLEALQKANAARFAEMVDLVESTANIVASVVERHFEIEMLNAAAFEPGFGGTCANFGPKDDGIKACPEILAQFDPGDWEDEFGILTSASQKAQ